MGTTHFVRAVWRADCPDREPDLIYRTTDGYNCWRWNPERIEMLEHRYLADPGPGLVVHHVDHDKVCNEPHNLDPLTPQEHSKRHSSITDEELLALHALGWTTVAIGREVGLHFSQVSRRLRGAGAVVGPRRRNLGSEVEQAILAFAADGWRSPWIAERVGVSKHVVKRFLRERGAGGPAGRPSAAAIERQRQSPALRP